MADPSRLDSSHLLLVVGSLLAACGLVWAGGDGATVLLLGALVVAFLIGSTTRWPTLAIVALLVLPQVPLLALLYELGLPRALVAAMSQIREAVALGLVLAALRGRARGDLDRVEQWGLGFVGGVMGYVVLRLVLASTIGDPFPRAPSGLTAQLVTIRLNVLWVVVLLAIRRLALTDRERDLVQKVVVVFAVVLGVGAIIEILQPELFSTITHDVLNVPRYQTHILGVERRLVVRTGFSGLTIRRAGSLLYAPLVVGFAMLPGLALALERYQREHSVRYLLGVGLIAVGVVFTASRAALLAALVVIGMLTFARAGSQSGGTGRRLLIAAVFLGVITTTAQSTNLTDRISAAATQSDASSQGHVARMARGMNLILHNPAGLGPGLNPSVVKRTGGLSTQAESVYLQIGIEFGVLILGAFIGFLLVLRRELASSATAAGAAGAAALTGMMVGGLILPAFAGLSAVLLLAVALGIAAPRDDGSGRPPATASTGGGSGLRPRQELTL